MIASFLCTGGQGHTAGGASARAAGHHDLVGAPSAVRPPPAFPHPAARPHQAIENLQIYKSKICKFVNFVNL